MTRFVDLPDEVQLAVINSVDPDDLVSFCCVSRAIHERSKDALTRHLRFRRSFEKIHLDRYHHPINILYAVRQNPILAKYIKKIHYSGVCNDWQHLHDFQLQPGALLHYGGAPGPIRPIRWQPREIASFMPELRDNDTVAQHDILWNMWRKFLQQGLHPAFLLLLMMHLPRLKWLRITSPDLPTTILSIFLKAWQEEFNEPSTTESDDSRRSFDYHWEIYPHKLNRPSLECIEISNNTTGFCLYGLDDLCALSSYSSLKTFRGQHLSAFDWEDAMNDSPMAGGLPELQSSALTTLELTDSKISVSSLRLSLSQIPDLHTFRMTFSSGSPTPKPWDSLPAIVSALEQTHSKKIQHLSLINPYDYGSTPQIASFQSFVRLKTLEISLATLLPHSTWREKEAYLMTGGRAPPISTVLPPSCAEVTLGIEIAPSALSESGLLRGWPKRQVFPLGLQGEILPTQQRWGWEVFNQGEENPFGGIGFNGQNVPAGRSTRPAIDTISAINTRHALSWSAAVGAPMPAHALHPVPDVSALPTNRSTYDGSPAGPSRAQPRPQPPSQPLLHSQGQGPNQDISLLTTAPRGTHSFGTSISMPSVTDSSGSVVNPLLTRLRKVNYFCCPTSVVRCDCIDAGLLGEYEGGAFLSLEIRRKVLSGWMGGFEGVWEGD
ncbi:hypothetical protein BDZ85DRAFT_268226 [Elsinoe ampelina]|uniref:F-box domain-containing protein n=1 Tax=Elsinoe ampelina TaxID=302913 RepID=A0A6A6G1X5_9PEZI|nr:hypothetical protein BDZ85DRAFT_268226 [Elsinoe ampelina]